MKEIIILLIGLLIGMLLEHNLTIPKVDLPEEYQLINKNTPIQGHFVGKTLIIEFKHNYK